MARVTIFQTGYGKTSEKEILYNIQQIVGKCGIRLKILWILNFLVHFFFFFLPLVIVVVIVFVMQNIGIDDRIPSALITELHDQCFGVIMVTTKPIRELKNVFYIKIYKKE